MIDVSRAFTNGALPFSGTDSGAAVQGPQQKVLDALQAIKELHVPALGIGKAPANGSLVSNANGAPQLGGITLNFSPDDLAAALLTLQSKTQEAQLTTAKEGLVTNSKKLEDQKQRSLDKIKDWVDKCKAADAKAKAGGILGWFKKIFTAVAAVFAVAVAAIATVATGGAAAPLLALAVLGLASAITSIASDIDKARGGKGFDHVLQWMDPGSLVGKGMAELAKAMGASDEQAAIVSAVFAVATTLAIIVASVVLTGGTSAGSALEGLSKTIMTASRIGQAVVGVAGGVTQVAQGGINIAVAHDQRDAAVIQSDKKKIDAIIVKLQQQMEEGREDIKKVMDEIMEGMNIVSQMINASDASRSQITANMTGKGHSI